MRRTLGLVAVTAAVWGAAVEAEEGRVNEMKVGEPLAVQQQRPELSGCAVVEGGVLVVEDELIGAVLLLEDLAQRPLELSTVKLERKKKARAPYASAFKLFPFHDFEDIASDDALSVYVIGSHNGKDGERRPDREFLIKAEWDREHRELKVIGEQYRLLERIAPSLESLGCGIGLTNTEVSTTLNIEGLALQGETLYIGLRSPLSPTGKAILLSGPAKDIMSGSGPLKAEELDLGGQGIRALNWDPALKTLLVLSGPSFDPTTESISEVLGFDPPTSTLTKMLTFEPAIARKGPEGICRLPGNAGGKLLVVLDGEGGAQGAELIEIDG